MAPGELETYLQSEEAVAALREMLARCPGGHDSPEWDFYLSAPAEGLRAWWEVRPQPDVTRDNDPPFDRMPVAYFRPDGDRYIVSDLGEAVRALRLRTRLTPHEADVAASRVLMTMRNAPRWWVPNTCVGSAIEIPHGVPAADLPRALCRVLLAAYRVANLEIPCA